MSREREKLIRITYGLFDAIIVGIAFILAFSIRKQLTIPPLQPFDEDLYGYAWLVSFIVLIWWQLLNLNKVNNVSHRGKSIRVVFRAILKTNMQGLLLIGFITFILKDEWVSRSLIIIFIFRQKFSG